MSGKKETMGKHAAAPQSPQDASQTQQIPPVQQAQPGAFNSAFQAAGVSDPKVGKGFNKRLALKVGVIIAAVLLVVYIAGAFFFSGRFFPNTTLGSQDISLKSTSDVAEVATDIGSDYSVTVTGDGLSFTVSSSQAGLEVDGQEVAEQSIADNNIWLWPVEVFRTHDESANLSSEYSESGLGDVVRQQVETFNATATDPVNASVQYSSASGQFEVSAEKAGTKLDVDAVILKVNDAVLDMSSSATLGTSELVQPTVLSSDPALTAAADTANSYLTADIELVLGTTAIHAADIGANEISQWVVIGDDLAVTFDEEAMDAWVEELAASLNTVGTERTYTRPDGQTFTVSGGTYGWTIDDDAMVADVEDAIRNGLVGQLTVATTLEGYTYNGSGVQDWGAYADVDISEQHVRFYNEAGELVWEADCVTGKPDGSHDTPTGVWRVLNKKTNYTLTGDISVATGQPEYETKVSYWMPFTYSGCGFHDATWQSAFGGTRYKDGYGSHGCVNLSLSDAASLYDIIAVGNAVVVHE